MLLSTAKKIEEEISNNKFLLRGASFIEKGSIKLINKREAKRFLIKFLLVECIAGVNYSHADLLKVYRKIKKLANKQKIYSEELPLLDGKSQTDKELQHVYYQLEGNICTYKNTSI